MSRKRHLRRGIYILPTLFTVGCLFCGYSSVVEAAAGRFERAAVLVVVAAVLDALDGRVARLSGTSSPFGLEFDSLADIVSFGVAPAVLIYQWGLSQAGRVGWLAAFLFVVCAATRLARFNLKKSPADNRYFPGLPSPPAGTFLACVVYAFPARLDQRWLASTLSVLVFLVATLMISHVRYRSFKDVDLRDRRSYVYVLPIAAIIVGVALHPPAAMLLITTSYLCSGVAVYAWNLARRAGAADGSAPRETEVADEPAAR